MMWDVGAVAVLGVGLLGNRLDSVKAEVDTYD
jgi:hypothetical protein